MKLTRCGINKWASGTGCSGEAALLALFHLSFQVFNNPIDGGDQFMVPLALGPLLFRSQHDGELVQQVAFFLPNAHGFAPEVSNETPPENFRDAQTGGVSRNPHLRHSSEERKGSTEYPGPIGLHGPYSGMFAALDFLDAARLLTKKVARITILQLSFSSGLSDIAARVMRRDVHCDPNGFPRKCRAIQICLQVSSPSRR